MLRLNAKQFKSWKKRGFFVKAHDEQVIVPKATTATKVKKEKR